MNFDYNKRICSMINLKHIAAVIFLAAAANVFAAGAGSQQSLLLADEGQAVTERAAWTHPNLTYTAKSVFTLAGVPMQWGGFGLSGGFANRYPIQSSGEAWPGGLSAVLPFGDSDKYFGGAIAGGWANQGGSGLASSAFSKNAGLLTLVFSKWIADSTIISGGVLSLASWGANQHIPKSYTGVITQMFGPHIFGQYHPISASVGCGTGSLSPIGSNASLHDSKIYPYVNSAFNFTQNFAVAGDYYSQTFAVGLSYNTAINIGIPLPLSFLVFAGNLRHTALAPSTTYGLRISTGFDLPIINRH
jgi:hypothetical protein